MMLLLALLGCTEPDCNQLATIRDTECPCRDFTSDWYPVVCRPDQFASVWASAGEDNPTVTLCTCGRPPW